MGRILFFAVLMLFFSCNNKPGNITISGVVRDSLTNNPISRAQVMILCWKETGIDDVEYDIFDTVTNEKGYYLLNFKEGYKIDIASIAASYAPSAIEIKSPSSQTRVEIKLRPTKSDESNIAVKELSLATRKQKDSKDSSVIGINLLEGSNTLTRENADIWKEISGDGLILSTLELGGIIPIFANDPLEAPLAGYVQKYKVRGDEKGFYVKCRNGRIFARMIIISSKYYKSVPYLGGYYEEAGMLFRTYLNETGGRGFGSLPTDYSLEQFILQNI